MLILKKNIPQSFQITYDVTAEDTKNSGDIVDAKFFLATAPGEADDKYLLKSYNSGLTYSAGTWTVTIDQGDLTSIDTDFDYEGVLAIQYGGDTTFREPDLFEGTDPLVVRVEPSYST